MSNRNKTINKNSMLEIIAKMTIFFVMSLMATIFINKAEALEAGADTVSVIARGYQGGSEATGYVSTIPSELQYKYDKNAYLGYIREGSRQTKKITEAGNYNEIFFCLDDTLEFPTAKTHTYKRLGELKNVSNIGGNKTLSQTQRNKLYYFLERTYFREEAKGSTRDQALALKKDRFRRSYLYNLDTGSSTIPNPSLAETSAIRAYMLEVTDDDYALINQWIIWYIVSGNDLFGSLPMNMVTNSGTINPTQQRTILRKQLYNYLKADVDKNGANYSKYLGQGTSLNSNVINGGTTYAETEKGFELKHFNVDIPEGQEAAVTDIKMYYADKDEHAISEVPRNEYTIIRENGTVESGNLKSLNKKGKFKIVFNRKLTEQEAGIRFETVINNTGMQANVYTPTLDKRYQPIVHITRKPQEKRFAFVLKKKIPEPPENDLALRKYISSIDGVAPKVSREPKLDVTKLRNALHKSGTDTTITYKHPKNALKAKIGSTVEYTIKIYNEVTTPGKVTKIVDQLPPHMKLKEGSAINAKYGWVQESNNKVSTTYYQNKTIPGMNYINSSVVVPTLELKIEAVVLDTAVPGHKQTNIAYIDGQNPLPDRDSVPGDTKIPTNLEDYKGHDSNKGDLSDPNYHYKGQQDDDDFESVIIEEPVVDLALRKSIIGIDGVAPEVSREPRVETNNLKNELNKQGSNTTAEYKHPKNPLKVKVGSTVKYRIRVFNEVEAPGKVTKIIDQLPPHMKLKEGSQINAKYGWVQESEDKISTTVLSGQVIQGVQNSGGKVVLDSKYVEVETVVVNTAVPGKVMTNVAYIEGQAPKKDRDSTPGNTRTPSDLSPYKGNGSNKSDLSDPNYHYKGQEDDDDFEKVILEEPEADLALRKSITGIDGVAPEVSREPRVETKDLQNEMKRDGKNTTAEYNHPKNPLKVKVGSTVKYKITVFNESTVPGKATIIKDKLPPHMKLKEGSQINAKYGWKQVGDEVATSALENQILNPTTLEGGKLKLDSKYVEIELEVLDTATNKNVLTNIAYIEGQTPKKDRDSTPGNTKKDGDISGYTGNGSNKKELNDPNYHYKGQEDDDDFEKVIVERPEADLALRKFIEKVVGKDGKENKVDRAPKVNAEPLLKGKTTAEYNHSKDPVMVFPENIVYYTIRVYNEGELDAFAKKVQDNVPKGLEFLPEHEINKKYLWKTVEKEINGSKQQVIETDYLSKTESEKRKEKPLKAFDPKKVKDVNPLDYRDLKVAFKVSKDFKAENGIIENIAEITDIEDPDGKKLKDRDSDPGNNKEGEDDIDKEKIKTPKFDLALRKIVSKVFVTTDGKTKTINTGHKYKDEPEAVAKIELDSKKWDKTTVRYEFKMRITNEGNIEGYATEISDYIPKGLTFNKKENPKWKVTRDRNGMEIATTDQLKGKLLKPGETAEVTIILDWIKDSKNFGVKTNWAEISKDKNKYGIPDIDSVPGNNKKGEDDIDYAPVALAISTGKAFTYFIATTTLVAIVGAGTVGIKKYFLSNTHYYI